jgi:putative flavoprotein involved in K+ transport
VRRATTIVIGAGQAGLAMSHCLSELGIDHAVLERGQVAERWRATSWDSLRLLTPNWMSRLPGFRYDGDDPDGFMSATDLVSLLERYARISRAPVYGGTTVDVVEPGPDGFRVRTNRGGWSASSVVIATGYCDLPFVPEMHKELSPAIHQLVPGDYRSPEQLPDGGVLVVGASATGVQLADELQAAGREVLLAVGRHTRLPRRYRGRDILWWLDRLGILSAPIEAVHDIAISRDKPSLQLVGRADCATIDLASLHARGVRMAGRLIAIDRRHARFDSDMTGSMAAADVKLAEIRGRIDQFIAAHEVWAAAPEPFIPTWPLSMDGPADLDLDAEGIRTVIWATGFRRAYRWLRIPVLDGSGEIQHRAGITPCPGLYVLGLNFQRRRNSSFIDGVGSDARFIARELAATVATARSA